MVSGAVTAIIGAFIVTRLQTEVSSISYSLWPLVIGAFFIALVFLFPEGLLPFARRDLKQNRHRLHLPSTTS